jgi:nanoRNase/pAp phosphatase (c-di-AMP/oligoRNAs hydrolase)
MVSEIGEKVLATHVDVKLAIMYYYNTTEKLYRFSIRSRKEEIDCTLIAQKYGGNGHKESAGFKIPSNCDELFKELEKFNTIKLIK